MTSPYTNQTLLIANRGEIAVRILRSAKELGIRTVSVYTPADALAPHVTLADVSALLPNPEDSNATEGVAYLDQSALIAICKAHNVTLLHPGYGFLSENAQFAQSVIDEGITWLGPSPGSIKLMGMKHEARRLVRDFGSHNTGSGATGTGEVQIDVVPGSEELVRDADEAVSVAEKVGLPVIFKPSAGGGGLGMVVCTSLEEVMEKFEGTRKRAMTLFGDDGIFIERYFSRARHVEVQIFGDGMGNAIHLRERECSVQRRHQKIIEESPSPFLGSHPGLRETICNAAVALCQFIKYESAGTVEFLVDDETGAFYFLEMNTRIQVEHPVTEVLYGDLDIIAMMINHGLSRRGATIEETHMQQATYDRLRALSQEAGKEYVIEGRVYAENPAENFLPSPGLLQFVHLTEKYSWLRVDSWVSTGMQITPHFDPLLCKIIVYGGTREEAISRFVQALEECKIHGSPNNMEYLRAIAISPTFRDGKVTTRFLDNFQYTPRTMKVLTPGIEMTIQDLPGRMIGKGIPRSGPMDPIALTVGNILVGNDQTTEGIEMIVVPGVPSCFQFLCSAVVAVTGKQTDVKVGGRRMDTWSRLIVPAGKKLELEARRGEDEGGLRVYLSVRGGFPRIPKYLGSKSTSMGLGGYQGRSLMVGDSLELGDCDPNDGDVVFTLPREIIPSYPRDCVIYVLSGPQDDEGFVTKEGITKFYGTRWLISRSSNRMGIRLESSEKIEWARESGGEGGAHPSNILDNGYALGTINVNGDVPVILANEGPDMGGYLCLCTVATAEMWKLGQLSPGCSVLFRRISYVTAQKISDHNRDWMASVAEMVAGNPGVLPGQLHYADLEDQPYPPKLYQKSGSGGNGKGFVLRQAGDSAILAEFGKMELDFFVRARIQAFMKKLESMNVSGLGNLCPCIRSLTCHYDNSVISQNELVKLLIATEQTVPEDLADMSFPGRRITFPVVLDDPWCREATERYMKSIREKAVYLPSNVEYLAQNNGLNSPMETLTKLVSSDWIAFGVGFYLACPFLVPIDPRSRLTGQKFNPSRTFTPRGAVGIAGPVAAIYPIDSPGGYQLFGRSLPTWHAWGKGQGFTPDKPWLLETFDQVRFEPVEADKYRELEKLFDQGRYAFKMESTVFSLKEYASFLNPLQEEIVEFRKQQQLSVEAARQRERTLLLEWERNKAEKAQGDPGAEAQESVLNVSSDVIKSPLFASIWKIPCKIGDTIASAEHTLIVLEAMKTEIPVRPNEAHAGKTVRSFGPGVREGAHVKPGDILVIFA